jgi:nucleotide-binding universal stress UspA family protein
MAQNRLSLRPSEESRMKILLPVDGSEYTQRTLAYLAAHDELLGPGHDYVAVNVVAPVPARAASFIDRATLDGYYSEQAEQVFEPIRAFAAQKGWNLKTVHVVGHAASGIAGCAEQEHAALIVMGAHGHGALASALLGSVTMGVLARCKTPVLIVR